VSRATIQRARKIAKEGSEEDIKDIENNKASISNVYSRLKKEKPAREESGTGENADDYPEDNREENGEDIPQGSTLMEGDILEGATDDGTAGGAYQQEPAVEERRDIALYYADFIQEFESNGAIKDAIEKIITDGGMDSTDGVLRGFIGGWLTCGK
jgi:hypothetical protein